MQGNTGAVPVADTLLWRQSLDAIWRRVDFDARRAQALGQGVAQRISFAVRNAANGRYSLHADGFASALRDIAHGTIAARPARKAQ